jgi:hypothetical protein
MGRRRLDRTPADARTDRRVSVRLSASPAALAAQQSRLRPHRTVSRTVYLYIVEHGVDVLYCRRQGLPGRHGTGTSVRRCMPDGDRPIGGGADRGSRRRGRTGARPGRPDAAGLEDRAPGWPGWRPGACGPPGRSGAGRRTPARNHRVGRGSGRRPGACERRGGAGRCGPGSRGTGGCGCPVRRARSCHHAE